MPQQQFAYGKNSVNGCPCPALAAGYEPGTDKYTTELAEEFDATLIEMGESDSLTEFGTVDEETAKAAWEKVAQYYEDTAKTVTETKQSEYHFALTERAKEIARELNWD